MQTSKLLLPALMFFIFLSTGFSQNVGVGTPTPEDKLHVAGNLKVDSTLKINRIELRDSLGELRLSFDANSGSFQMWDNDTLWFSQEVNSPRKDTTWTSKNTFNVTFVQDKTFYHQMYKRVGSANILVHNRCGHTDPDSNPAGFPYKLEQFYKNGCKTMQIEILKVDAITLPAEVEAICGSFGDVGEIVIKTWYDCPFNPETVVKVEYHTKKGTITFHQNAAGEVTSMEWKGKGKNLTYKKGVNEATVRVVKGDTIITTKFKGNDTLRVQQIADGTVKTIKTVEDVNNNRKITTTTCPREGKMKIELHDGTTFELDLCTIIKSKFNSVRKEEQMLEDAYWESYRKGAGAMGFGYDPNSNTVEVEGVKERKHLIPPAQDDFSFLFEHDLGAMMGLRILPLAGAIEVEKAGESISKTTLQQDSITQEMVGNNEAIQTAYGLNNGNPTLSISSQNSPMLMQVYADMDVIGNFSKLGGTFKIDHPQDPYNKYLYHSFVESPDMMNIYNGNVETDQDGYATIKLPDYFEALNINPRYQLTVVGKFAQAIIKEEVKGNQFVIQTSEPNTKVSWQVTGIRNDLYAKENRVVDEVEKVGSDKGKLMYKSLNK